MSPLQWPTSDIPGAKLERAWSPLVAHAVNSLSLEYPCCPHECAACGALLTLHECNVLDAALTPYLAGGGGWTWDWWNDEDGSFNWAWVTSRWCDLTTCENAINEEEK